MPGLGDYPEAQEDVAKVAEMASEPSYVSEVARKLQLADARFASYNLTTVIDIVRKAVQALDETRDYDVDVARVGYSNIGGQEEASPIYSWVEGELRENDEWWPYTLFHVENQPVRESYRKYVDRSIAVEDKIGTIDTLSYDGNEISKEAELILQDLVTSDLISDIGYYETPSYNDGGVDLYLEDFNSNITGKKEHIDGGVIIEISVRWINPIGIPYMEEKTNKREEYESDRDVPVDLIVLAPSFTGTVENTYSDTGISRIGRVPIEPDGNPILLQDEESLRNMASSLPFTGNMYPVVRSSRANMIGALDSVARDYDTIYELDYRRDLLQVLGRLL